MRYSKLLVSSLLIAFSLLLSTCKKETKVNSNAAEQNSFLHIYPSENSQYCYNIVPSGDGGFILLTEKGNNNGSYSTYVTKVGSSGNFEWETAIEDTITTPQVTVLKDGSILLCSMESIGNIVKIDNQGKVIFNKKYSGYSSSYLYSPPLQAANGSFYNTRSNGHGTGGAAFNQIIAYDSEGKAISGNSINDLILGGKSYIFYIYKYEEPQTYYLYGIFFPHPFNGWTQNGRLYVAKLEMSGGTLLSKKIKILDPDNTSYRNFPIYKTQLLLRHLNTPDNKLLISTIQRDHTGFFKGHLSKVDENLNKLWALDLKIGTGNTVSYSVVMANDGNYLVCGTCNQEGKLLEQPFVAKISTDGKILSTRIYEMPNNSIFNSVYQNAEGNYFFVGTTNSFGKGKDKTDFFLMKTDKEGNLK